MGRDQRVDLDQLVARRDDGDLRRMGDGQGGVAAGGRDRDLAARSAARPRGTMTSPARWSRAAAVDVCAGAGHVPGAATVHRSPSRDRLLVGDDAVGARRQHGAGHDLDAGVRRPGRA